MEHLTLPSVASKKAILPKALAHSPNFQKKKNLKINSFQ
jgi:hypothetical protein